MSSDETYMTEDSCTIIEGLINQAKVDDKTEALKCGEKLLLDLFKDSDNWISVEDRLPVDFNKKLLCYRKSGEVNIYFWHDIMFYIKYAKDGDIPTHWQPLPSAPKKEEKL